MIVDPYLRAIVEKSGRREITSSMVARAEKEREKDRGNILCRLAERQREALQSQMALQQS